MVKKYGFFDAGIPKHDTIARVVCRLKADEIESAFQSCISSLIETTGADIIAIDAMRCQQEIAKQIIKQKADYILALKGNHCGMQSELKAWWHKSEGEGLSNNNYDKHTEISSGHGRIETRTCQQLLIDKTWLAKTYQWPGLKSIVKVSAEVYDKLAGTESTETRWYIRSLDLSAEQAHNAVLSHWQVESMHWMLDMTFGEDGKASR